MNNVRPGYIRKVIYERPPGYKDETYWNGVLIRTPDRVEIEYRHDQLYRDKK